MSAKYAVLICGDNASFYAYDEFWNDLVLMYKILLKNNFNSNNILVLYGNGEDFSDSICTNPMYKPPNSIVNFAATQENVRLVFRSLENGNDNIRIPRMNQNDILFIWTFGHGNRINGISTLNL